jgi:8-oxo-dGTP pyrophosphatase MutT (NUDIX family)
VQNDIADVDPVTIAARPASTVALLRTGSAGLEVFLVRRHDNVAFMGGAHVFPGGRVEAADRVPDTGGDAALDASVARMAGLGRSDAIAFHVAAIRELFEEAGVLLARNAGGALADIADDETAERPRIRREIAAGTIDFADFLRRRHWHPAFDALAYVAHWVTPEIDSRRFDTRFFFAAAPAGQNASHDQSETTDGVWMTARGAIDRCRRGEIALPPPTWTTLRWLEPFDTPDDALAWARQQRVARVQPLVKQAGEHRMILLPGDPLYPSVPGFSARETRFLLSAGSWRPLDGTPDS